MEQEGKLQSLPHSFQHSPDTMCYLYGKPDMMHRILFLELHLKATAISQHKNEGVPEMECIMFGLPQRWQTPSLGFAPFTGCHSFKITECYEKQGNLSVSSISHSLFICYTTYVAASICCHVCLKDFPLFNSTLIQLQ